MRMLSEVEIKLDHLAKLLKIENNLIHFLFLIGIQESGKGFKRFSKDEKLDLIELGSTTLLAKHNYYIEIETESEVPFYVANPDKSLPEINERKMLLKKEIVNYLENKLNYYD